LRSRFAAAREAEQAKAAIAAADAKDTWHLKALVATAVARVREMQVLQAPHSAEADDPCEGSLQDLRAAWAKRGFYGTR
jgi:hypothetical protein